MHLWLRSKVSGTGFLDFARHEAGEVLTGPVDRVEFLK